MNSILFNTLNPQSFLAVNHAPAVVNPPSQTDVLFAGPKKSPQRLQVDQYLQTHYVNTDGANHGKPVSPRLLARAIVGTIYTGVEVTEQQILRLAGLIKKSAEELKIRLMNQTEVQQAIWANASEEDRAAVGARKSAEWRALSPDERERRAQASRERFELMSPDERAAWAQRCRVAANTRLEAMSEEQRAEYSRRLSEAGRATWAGMNAEERAAQIEASRQGQLQYWAGLSDEEREARAVVLRQRWADMSDEERTAVGDAISEAQTARWEGMDDETYQAFCDNARELFWAQPEEVRLRMLAAMTAREQQGN